MPIYDYRCDQRQAIFEVSASFKEKELGLKPIYRNCQSAETPQILTAGYFMHQGNRDGVSSLSSCCSPNSGAGFCSR